MRNRIARLELTPSQGVGGVVLLDERWKRRTAGILGSPGDEADQPLLAERYFLAKALSPYADLREGPIDDLTQGPLSLLVMPDTGRIDPGQRAKLEAWMKGRRPGPLRRARGSPRAATNWSGAAAPGRPDAGRRALLAAAAEAGAVRSRRAVRRPADARGRARQPPGAGGARPPTSSAATLATLEDGTPLITGASSGKGRLILVHTTANTTGVAAALGRCSSTCCAGSWRWRPGAGGTPRAGRAGRCSTPSAASRASAAVAADPGRAAWPRTPPAPDHPPGLYAPARAATPASDEQPARLALNLQPAVAAARAARPRRRWARPRRPTADRLSGSWGPGCSPRPAAGARRHRDRLRCCAA